MSKIKNSGTEKGKFQKSKGVRCQESRVIFLIKANDFKITKLF